MYNNMRNEINSSHRVRSNLGSANHSFVNHSAVPTSALEAKWSNENYINTL